jgi:thiamine pyrophosphokinase
MGAEGSAVGSVPAAMVVAVVIGGGPVHAPDRHFDVVIAADSGVDVALRAGFTPTSVVGDLDSISADGMRWVREHGITVERHPADKDATDTALALAQAMQLGAQHLVVFGGTGIDRLDHLLGTIVSLGDPSLASLSSITAHLGASTLHVVHPDRHVTLDLAAGAVFSLLPVHGDCGGVDVSGARWPLERAVLPAASTRGVSNESLGSPIEVSVTHGVLTVVVPSPEVEPTIGDVTTTRAPGHGAPPSHTAKDPE